MRKFVAGPALLAVATSAAAQESPQLEFVFEEIVTLAPAVTVGRTARGERRFIPITGGTFEGPAIRGEVLPGGWDWQLVRPDGCLEIEADYFLRTDDGVIINVLNKGVICRPEPDAAPYPVRTQPVFEAPLGEYEWLSQGAFVGTLESVTEGEAPAVRIRFFRAR